MTLGDLERLINISNDMEHRAASLRHLSFLLYNVLLLRVYTVDCGLCVCLLDNIKWCYITYMY